MMRNITYLFLIVCAVFLTGRSFADSITVGGSSSFYNAIFDRRVDDIRARTGLDFDVYVSSSGRGLMALAEGKLDIAMISTDFLPLLHNVTNNFDVDMNAADYDYTVIDDTEIVFVVHKDNPVNSLTRDQVREIFLGKITNWSTFGYPDLGDISVVTEHPTGGMYLAIRDGLLDGNDFLFDHIFVQSAPQATKIISQLPSSIGFLSAKTNPNLMSNVKIIDYGDQKIRQILGLVYPKNHTSETVQKLVNSLLQGNP